MTDLTNTTIPASSADDTLISLIDQALLRQSKKKPARHYLGASRLGVACDRALQYEYLNLPKDEGRDFDARLLRIFERGHRMETIMASWLKAAGFELYTEQNDGSPFGFSEMHGQFKGHADGVIVDGPHDYNYPMLWENKALGNRTWQSLKKKGLSIVCPTYAAQVALYQAYLNLPNPALLTAINADTMAIYVEWVPFNGELAQRSSDRAVNILQACTAKEWLPRLSFDADYYQCKLCPWQQRCWKPTASSINDKDGSHDA